MEVVCGGEGDPECKKMREVEVVCGYLATKLYSLGLGCVIQKVVPNYGAPRCEPCGLSLCVAQQHPYSTQLSTNPVSKGFPGPSYPS